MKTAVQVTMYLHESDKWHLILQTLRNENVAGASAFHAVAGFTGRNSVHTEGLVEAGGNLPVVMIFVDFEEHVNRVLPDSVLRQQKTLVTKKNANFCHLAPSESTIWQPE